uniref:Uncharacterized protein n=1 Tax=Anopheles atroparvus TaxID=41427 RepID=A0AAG5DC38_ANOAO
MRCRVPYNIIMRHELFISQHTLVSWSTSTDPVSFRCVFHTFDNCWRRKQDGSALPRWRWRKNPHRLSHHRSGPPI